MLAELAGAGDLVVGVNRPIQHDGDVNVGVRPRYAARLPQFLVRQPPPKAE